MLSDLQCNLLGVAKGSYFNQTLRNKKGNTLDAQKRAEITPVIEQIFQDSNQIFGAGKIQVILKNKGYRIATKTVSDIMHKNGWFPVRSCAKTLYLQGQKRKKNILEQQFIATRPNEIWVGDVKYIDFYNKERPHTYLRYWTPDKYEEPYYRNHQALDKNQS